ncbi:glycerophosphoryl diester phosphodiesterase membrane domain-containing protein [Occallatibacter riparius]|uniref:Glycerophosphoryl diester phosphodiesterase membrane domain-containing protein n=1 Tax=Occallatibacter riparius TaxID=1002689 RepID=A0A9J7BRA8_9BACT|nr:glycerophosphoryl diester phosphodiesterase membrane domain-containing protein [Occallatibacter riparius]UWZ84290.1 glycerophosphoryl diester phosphodiesterase membrane domain-containing protein [Occallatibacter riparius]
METNLRPLTLGEILDRTAQLYRTNFLLFAGMFSIYAAVSLVLALLQLGLITLVKGKTWAAIASLSVGGLRLIFIFLLLGAAIAAISRAVAAVNLGEPVTIRSAYASTLPKLGRYLWLMTITFFRAWGPVLSVYGGLILAMFLIPAKHASSAGTAPTGPAATPSQDPAILAIVGVGLLLFFLPCLVYAVWMNIRYALAIPACVVENLKARAAIKRSIELSKGARPRIFALLLLVLVIKVGLVGLTQSFVLVMAFKHPAHIAPGVSALSQVIQFFTNTFLGPIGATGVTLFYFDQRVRKEGYDIEWMMLAAGMTPGPAITAPAVNTESISTVEPTLAAEPVLASQPELPTADLAPAADTPGTLHE